MQIVDVCITSVENTKNIQINNISKMAESQFMIVVDVFAHTNANQSLEEK